MPGGVMQLVAVAAQDQFITGSPDMSYFKQVYKRHTNFSMESVHQLFDSKPVLKLGTSTYTCRINRVADLLREVYLSYILPDIYSTDKFRFRWIKNISHYIIKRCSVYIDTQLIDELWGEWMDVWNELTLSTDHYVNVNRMMGNTSEFYNPTTLEPYVVIDNNNLSYSNYPIGTSSPSISGKRFYVPIPFWFTKNPGLALPLVALQYQNIDIVFEFRGREELYQIYDNINLEYISPVEYRKRYPEQSTVKVNNDITGNINLENRDVSLERFLVPVGSSYADTTPLVDIDAYLECNFVFLDEDERRTLALKTNDYLVERVQRIEDGGINNIATTDLIIQNPVKEFVWVYQRNDITSYNDWSNYTDSLTNISTTPILSTAKFMWNGMDRIADKPPEYYNYIQPYQHHTRNPRDGIYVYSFSIFPEKMQPSGSFNASSINKIQMYHTTKIPTNSYNYNVIIFSKYYNVFRVMSGSGAMVFAN